MPPNRARVHCGPCPLWPRRPVRYRTVAACTTNISRNGSESCFFLLERLSPEAVSYVAIPPRPRAHQLSTVSKYGSARDPPRPPRILGWVENFMAGSQCAAPPCGPLPDLDKYLNAACTWAAVASSSAASSSAGRSRSAQRSTTSPTGRPYPGPAAASDELCELRHRPWRVR